MRREDLIGRIGGDEFALLVRVPSIAEGQGIARDIHARLSAVLAQSRYPVTCSMGALLIPPEVPRTISELIHAADQAMYRAKRGVQNPLFIAGLNSCAFPRNTMVRNQFPDCEIAFFPGHCLFFFRLCKDPRISYGRGCYILY